MWNASWIGVWLWLGLGAGDLDADGRMERIVAEPRDSALGASTGRVTVTSGRDGRVLFTWRGDSAGDRFGWSTALVGDVDGDGIGDVAVGAPLDDPTGNASGSAFVFSGRDGSTLHRWSGAAAREQLGYRVAAAGDVDDDGCADVLVGAPFAAANGERRGRVAVMSGRTGRVIAERVGERDGQRLGKSLRGPELLATIRLARTALRRSD